MVAYSDHRKWRPYQIVRLETRGTTVLRFTAGPLPVTHPTGCMMVSSTRLPASSMSLSTEVTLDFRAAHSPRKISRRSRTFSHIRALSDPDPAPRAGPPTRACCDADSAADTVPCRDNHGVLDAALRRCGAFRGGENRAHWQGHGAGPVG